MSGVRFWLAVGLMLVAARGEATVLCKTRSGTVKVRDACRVNEAPVDPVALGLHGPGGTC